MAHKFSSLGTKYFGRDGPKSITWLYFFFCVISLFKEMFLMQEDSKQSYVILIFQRFESTNHYSQSIIGLIDIPKALELIAISTVGIKIYYQHQHALCLVQPMSMCRASVPTFALPIKKKKEKCSYYQYRKPRTLSSAQFMRHMYGEQNTEN